LIGVSNSIALSLTRGRVLLGRVLDVAVELVERFERRRLAKPFDRVGMAAFARAVDHDRHRRAQAAQQRGVIIDIPAVVSHLIKIDLADLVGRADEALRDVPTQVGQIEEFKIAD
jgi:hypothetical protein